MTYNYKRPYEQRKARLDELTKKAVKKSIGSYMVIIGSDAYYGDETGAFSTETYYFENIRTAKAFAQHFTDIYDRRAGLFKTPKFICGIAEW